MITRPIRTALLLAACCCGLAACEGLQVRSDVNTTLIHTVQCRTVEWAGSFRNNTAISTTIANPLNESRLRAAIAAQLTAKGAQWVGSNADCLVGYGIGVRRVLEGAPAYGWGWGWGWGAWDGWYGPYGPGPYGPYAYREGLIAVDLYDARTHQPLWHAYVNQDLFGVTGTQAVERIDAAVAAIFTKYPG